MNDTLSRSYAKHTLITIPTIRIEKNRLPKHQIQSNIFTRYFISCSSFCARTSAMSQHPFSANFFSTLQLDGSLYGQLIFARICRQENNKTTRFLYEQIQSAAKMEILIGICDQYLSLYRCCTSGNSCLRLFFLIIS